jgi:DNA-binding NtrC family response regulator
MIARPPILIVDDDYAVREVLTASLGRKYDCMTTSSAGDALMLMQSHSFDLVILDVGLPDCSGLAVSLYVKKARPETIVIVISASTDEAIIELAKENGAYDFLRKPFTPTQIEGLVERALQHRATLAS